MKGAIDKLTDTFQCAGGFCSTQRGTFAAGFVQQALGVKDPNKVGAAIWMGVAFGLDVDGMQMIMRARAQSEASFLEVQSLLARGVTQPPSR